MKNRSAATELPRLTDLGPDLLQLTRCQRIRTLSIPFISCLAYWLFAWYGYWIFAVLSLVIMSFITYGSTSHDLVHHNLGLQRRANEFFLFLIEAISLRSGHAYQVVHLNHYARFPHEDDIEADASRMSFLRAILEGFVFHFEFISGRYEIREVD